jgi:hypothetical protein
MAMGAEGVEEEEPAGMSDMSQISSDTMKTNLVLERRG